MFALLNPAMQIIHFHSTTSDFIWELKQFPSKSLPGKLEKSHLICLMCRSVCLFFHYLLTQSFSSLLMLAPLAFIVATSLTAAVGKSQKKGVHLITARQRIKDVKIIIRIQGLL